MLNGKKHTDFFVNKSKFQNKLKMKGSHKRQSGVKNKMSINLDAIRAKVSQLSGLNKGRKDVLWKSEPGEYTVRLLPWKNNDGQPFK